MISLLLHGLWAGVAILLVIFILQGLAENAATKRRQRQWESLVGRSERGRAHLKQLKDRGLIS